MLEAGTKDGRDRFAPTVNRHHSSSSDILSNGTRNAPGFFLENKREQAAARKSRDTNQKEVIASSLTADTYPRNVSSRYCYDAPCVFACALWNTVGSSLLFFLFLFIVVFGLVWFGLFCFILPRTHFLVQRRYIMFSNISFRLMETVSCCANNWMSFLLDCWRSWATTLFVTSTHSAVDRNVFSHEKKKRKGRNWNYECRPSMYQQPQ